MFFTLEHIKAKASQVGLVTLGARMTVIPKDK